MTEAELEDLFNQLDKGETYGDKVEKKVVGELNSYRDGEKIKLEIKKYKKQLRSTKNVKNHRYNNKEKAEKRKSIRAHIKELEEKLETICPQTKKKTRT